MGHVNRNHSVPLCTALSERKTRGLDVLLSFKKWLTGEEAALAEGLPSPGWLVGKSVVVVING